MSICTLTTLERPSRVESFHTVSPASTRLPTLSVRCSLAQKEGREVSVSLTACRYAVCASQILASLGGCLTEKLAIQTVNQPSPRVCPWPASVVAESCGETKDLSYQRVYPCFSNAGTSLVDASAQSYEHGQGCDRVIHCFNPLHSTWKLLKPPNHVATCCN